MYSHPFSVRKNCIVLRAYIDDSGSHDGAPHCLLAGYWGGTNEWRRFERAWNAAIRDEGVTEFHAKTFWPRIHGKRLGEFKDWTDERHRRFIERLLAIIASHKIFPFGFGVLGSDWDKQTEEYRRVFCALDHSDCPNDELLKSIYMSFNMCVLRISRYCHPGKIMNFYLDDDPKTSGRMAASFLRIKSQMKGDGSCQIGSLNFSDSKDAAPLQAADLLAYELYRWRKRKDERNDETLRPEMMAALARFRTKDDFWLFDAPRFASLIKYVEATAKRAGE